MKSSSFQLQYETGPECGHEKSEALSPRDASPRMQQASLHIRHVKFFIIHTHTHSHTHTHTHDNNSRLRKK
ncbi:hypothetical protein CEP53_011085 [Fusarium sp. AF-6]|nr:hypothetical protein CEP53_011085 [Fusarium sp. AF-6]